MTKVLRISLFFALIACSAATARAQSALLYPTFCPTVDGATDNTGCLTSALKALGIGKFTTLEIPPVYVNAQPITGGSANSSTITFNVSNTAGCVAGSPVNVLGATPSSYNASYAIQSVSANTSVTVASTLNAGAPSGGSLSCATTTYNYTCLATTFPSVPTTWPNPVGRVHISKGAGLQCTLPPPDSNHIIQDDNQQPVIPNPGQSPQSSIGAPYNVCTTGCTAGRQLDLTTGGNYTGAGNSGQPYVYCVLINNDGSHFTWGKSANGTQNTCTGGGGPTAISAGTAQTLELGITITFANGSGYTAGSDQWNFVVTPSAVNASKQVNPGWISANSGAHAVTVAPNSLSFGGTNAPGPALIQGESAAPGLSNTAGGNLVLAPGLSTGNGSGAEVLIQECAQGSSGTIQNSCSNNGWAFLQNGNFNILTGGGIKATEGSAIAGDGTSDSIWPDSTAHRWKMNNHNGGAVQVVASGGDIDVSDHVTAIHPLTTFNGSTTLVANGLPVIVGEINLTGQFANISATNVTGLASGIGAGMYKFNCYEVVTTTDAVSSTLPNCLVVFHDFTTNVGASSTVAASSSGAPQVVGTSLTNGSKPIYVHSGGAIQYQTTGYASNTPATMQYDLHITVEYLGQ